MQIEVLGYTETRINDFPTWKWANFIKSLYWDDIFLEQAMLGKMCREGTLFFISFFIFYI